jgi:hypothetical protein
VAQGDCRACPPLQLLDRCLAPLRAGCGPGADGQYLERITQLILEICGGQAGPVDDLITGLPARKPVTMRTVACASVIGVPISD